MQNYTVKLKSFGFLIVILIFAFLFLILAQWGWSGEKVNLDEFAQCLADRGYMMYGAYWCPHCQNEKKGFGPSAWKRINYIECTKEPKRCLDAGIKGYPTWITNDGRRFEGEQGIDGLAEASGCSRGNPLPLSKGEN